MKWSCLYFHTYHGVQQQLSSSPSSFSEQKGGNDYSVKSSCCHRCHNHFWPSLYRRACCQQTWNGCWRVASWFHSWYLFFEMIIIMIAIPSSSSLDFMWKEKNLKYNVLNRSLLYKRHDESKWPSQHLFIVLLVLPLIQPYSLVLFVGRTWGFLSSTDNKKSSCICYSS